MTQDDLAALAPFSKRSLQDYEAGVSIPYRHLRELSRLLGRSPDWFLSGGDPEDAAIRLARLEEAVVELRDGVRIVIELLERQQEAP